MNNQKLKHYVSWRVITTLAIALILTGCGIKTETQTITCTTTYPIGEIVTMVKTLEPKVEVVAFTAPPHFITTTIYASQQDRVETITIPPSILTKTIIVDVVRRRTGSIAACINDVRVVDARLGRRVAVDRRFGRRSHLQVRLVAAACRQ